MTHLASFLTAMWLSTAAAQLGFIGSITKDVAKGITKEGTAVADPITKALVYVGSSQCATVKQIIGVAYDSNEEPDLSKLTLNFITKQVSITYNLLDAANYVPNSQWFNKSAPLKIYLHGFTDDPSKDSYQNINRALMTQGDYNVLALDASSLIKYFYLRSTTMVRFIGQALGDVLAAIVKTGYDPANIHLIGHSLGSHIAGFTGKKFLEMTGQRIGRLSGLDPAGPCFSNIDPTLRLDSNDANFVDVIHTDAGVYGLNAQVGHVDFYPNSGSEQPNCVFQTCSHSRAWLYMTESVNNTQAFVGVRCQSWKDYTKGKCDFNDTSVMGFGCPNTTRGVYYLQTNEESPYGRGEMGLSYVNNAAYIKQAFGLLG